MKALLYPSMPAIPSITKSLLVKVPVLSKQHISTFPANGILKGSVQNTPADRANNLIIR